MLKHFFLKNGYFLIGLIEKNKESKWNKYNVKEQNKKIFLGHKNANFYHKIS